MARWMVDGFVAAGGRKPSRARLAASVRVERKAGRSKEARGAGFGCFIRADIIRCFRDGLSTRQAHSEVLYCVQGLSSYCTPLEINTIALNAELTKKALEKVGNPNVLVNLISRRVRQLNSGGGASSRPLVSETGNLGAADIALLEIVEDKMGFEVPEPEELTRPVGRKRKRR